MKRVLASLIANRGQRIVLWAAVALAVIDALYPPTVLLRWDSERWQVVPAQVYMRWRYTPWVKQIGTRRFGFSETQWTDNVRDSTLRWQTDFKEVPDFRRVAIENSVFLSIGVGLLFALRKGDCHAQ